MTKQEFHAFYMNTMNRTFTVNGREFNVLSLGWTPTYGNTKKAIGRCRWNRRKGVKVIEISKHYLNIPGQNWETMKDTVLHEIAHAIDCEIRGTTDHSIHWKRVAEQVGANSARTTDQIEPPKGRYQLRCSKHGDRGTMHKQPSVRRACGLCCKEAGGGFHNEHLLSVIDTKTGYEVGFAAPRRKRDPYYFDLGF